MEVTIEGYLALKRSHDDLVKILYWILGNSKGGSEQADRIERALKRASGVGKGL